MNRYACWVAGLTFNLISLVLMTGCLSDHPGSRSIAYVEIPSSSATAIRSEAVRIFADDDYKLVSQTDKEMEFERIATQRDRVMFGSYGDDLVMRIVVIIEPRRQGGHLVRADAYAMNSGDVVKVMRVARRPYQNLLDRVKASLITATGNQ